MILFTSQVMLALTVALVGGSASASAKVNGTHHSQNGTHTTHAPKSSHTGTHNGTHTSSAHRAHKTHHGANYIPGVGSPHNYTGVPKGAYSPEWQKYFEVTKPLPHVSFNLPRSFAGNIDVGRQANDTLFFWGFEKTKGSLTRSANSTGGVNSTVKGTATKAAANATTNGDKEDPWGIWLSGGPGSSSMLGLLAENGPIKIGENDTASLNKYAWSNLADFFWIDQPVGTGFATAERTGFVADEDEMGQDFFAFLANLVKVFPSLATRPLYLTGESYAGRYIPYILKTYFSMPNPPVKIATIAVGDGILGSPTLYGPASVVSMIETYPQTIGYDESVYEYFKEQSHLCAYDLNLTYPQAGGAFPPLQVGPNSPIAFGPTAVRKNHFGPGSNGTSTNSTAISSATGSSTSASGSPTTSTSASATPSSMRRNLNIEKRDLSGRANGTIDPWYGCDLYDEWVDYAVNFSHPWKGNDFDALQIPDALEPDINLKQAGFMNDKRTVTALHAPRGKTWERRITYPWGGNVSNVDPSVEPMAFLSDLAKNASDKGVSIVLYSGNDDGIVPHFSQDVIIQNTTFGGVQGFTKRPSTHWTDDKGKFAGIVHQERNWTYVLIEGAGHFAPQDQPERSYVMMREFVLGTNRTGLVTSPNATAVGGEDPKFSGILTGSEIYTGSSKTEGTFKYPSATVAAWASFMGGNASVTPTATAGNGTAAIAGAGKSSASSSGRKHSASRTHTHKSHTSTRSHKSKSSATARAREFVY